MANGAVANPTPRWMTIVLGVVVLIMLAWQVATYCYLKNDLGEWLKDHGGDGQYPPPPPPKF